MIHFSQYSQYLVWSNTPRTQLGPLLASVTVPGSAFFCRRRGRGRPGWNSGLKDRHGRNVRYGDGVYSLDHHLHVLSHTACLAQSLNHLQERKAAPWQNAWTAKTAQSTWGNDLKETMKEKANDSHEEEINKTVNLVEKQLILIVKNNHL